MPLHHIGGKTACVYDGIMDARVIDHVLPQEIDTDIHKLQCIQRTSPQMRLLSRMGSNSFKRVEYLNIGKRCIHADTGGVIRVPCKRHVQAVKHTFPCHKSLGRSSLFRRATQKNHGAGAAVLFQIILNRYGRAHGCRSQKIVPAAVAVGFSFDRALVSIACGLIQAAKGIILTQNADHRFPGAERGGKCRFDFCQAGFHLKSFFPQYAHQIAR